jgi:hypothetical protein
MPRLSKTERERIKVTCLWCENAARLHLICTACLAPMSEAEQRQYIRVLPIETPARQCVCGVEFTHDAPENKKWCDSCRLIVRKLDKRARRRKISIGTGNTKSNVKRQIYYYRTILDGRCGMCSRQREPGRIGKRTCGRCISRQTQIRQTSQ